MIRVEGAERVGLIAVELFREPPAASLPPLARPAPVELAGEWRRGAGLTAGEPVEARFRPLPGHSLRVDYGLPATLRGPDLPLRVELTLTGSGGIEHTFELPFEYDQVVVYSEHAPEYLERRRSRLQRMRTRGGRVRAGGKSEPPPRGGELPAGAFGESPAAPQRHPRPTARPPQGPIDGWISRTVSLGDFVGQAVTARLDLLVEPGREGVCVIGEPMLLPGRGANALAVLVTSDAHRRDHVSVDGKGAIETPWIELLADRGVVFTDAWSPTNDPRAAWNAIFTGRGPGPRASGEPSAGEGGRRDASLPAVLGAADWLTVAILSSPVPDPASDLLLADFEQVIAPARVGPGGPEPTGFDAKRALDTLVELLPDLGERPSFVWVQVEDATAPYAPPDEFRREHYPADRNPRRATDDDPRPVPDWAEGVADVGYVQALYSAEVTWIDRRLRPLVEHPRLAGAVLVLAGTCGESLVSFSHDSPTPETLHVPLLVTAPGLGPRRIDRPVNLLDLGRTLLDLARVPHPSFPGHSLLRRGRDPDPEAREGPAAGEARTLDEGGPFALRGER